LRGIPKLPHLRVIDLGESGKKNQKRNLKNLFDFIRELIIGKFYGEIRIKFFGGEIRHVEKVESLDVEQFKT
jgi:hypothetical protein